VFAYDGSPLAVLEVADMRTQLLPDVLLVPSFMAHEMCRHLLPLASTALELSRQGASAVAPPISAAEVEALSESLRTVLSVSQLNVLDPVAPGGLVQAVATGTTAVAQLHDTSLQLQAQLLGSGRDDLFAILQQLQLRSDLLQRGLLKAAVELTRANTVQEADKGQNARALAYARKPAQLWVHKAPNRNLIRLGDTRE
jgi:hypothetical protein